MATIDDGGPAFPTVMTEAPGEAPVGTYVTTGDKPGMSLRDYFAAQAMVGIVNRDGWLWVAQKPSDPNEAVKWEMMVAEKKKMRMEDVAEAAYAYADAMLAARKAVSP